MKNRFLNERIKLTHLKDLSVLVEVVVVVVAAVTAVVVVAAVVVAPALLPMMHCSGTCSDNR